MREQEEEQIESTGRFKVVRRLGEGGMGVVFEVFDQERRAHLALKTLRSLSPDAVLRFKSEFRHLPGTRGRGAASTSPGYRPALRARRSRW